MENKKELIIETFNNSFNLQSFVNFTQELFKGNAKYRNSLEFSPKIKGEFNNVVKEFLELGWYKDKNKKSMVIAVVRLEREDSVARSRAIQRNFVKDYFLKNGTDSALVAFYNKNSGEWRLSFIKLDYSYKEAKLEEEITPAKRFSFLLGENEKHHTAIARFLPLISNDLSLPTIEEIEEIFNIEVVTREFFEIYCDLYLEIKKCIDKQEGFNEMAKKLDFKSDEFGKKIMGQLVFLYFLQKKGWLGVEANPKEINEDEADSLLKNKSYDSVDAFEKTYELKNGKYIRKDIIINKSKDEETIALNSIFTNTKYDGNWGSGDKNFIRSLFNKAMKEEKNFYKDYLEHVFYNALNDKRGGSIYFKELNCKIPFLNGGLFQPINEKYDYENSNFIIPNEIFSNSKKTKQGDSGDGILDIFDRYAFTVKEDEPLEKEVAVDPEMLGKVFENLLDVVDRKKKGAFYTPREIVHYMCQESLIKYLSTEVGIDYKDAEILIRYGDVLADIDSSKKASETGDFKMPLEIRRNAKKIDNAFLNVKIADPAVGSGAFPLGMLHEIVRARMNLTQYMIDNIDAIHKVYTNVKGRKPYDLKLQTIQRCIHAVDIERSAVDIAKLRLWLSLVVEENDFRNVKPLPNLDYNIMVGNSLLEEFEGVKLFNENLLEGKNDNLEIELLEQTNFLNGKKESEYLLDEIYDLQEKFFSVNNAGEKIKLKGDIDKLEWTLIEKTVRENGKEELLPKIKEFKRTNTKPYFLWKLNFAKVFREKGGFDIVIGNPPYIGEKGNKEIFHDIKNTDFGKRFYQRRMDLFYFFIAKGVELLKNKGIISFITTNYWVTASGGQEKFRPYLKKMVNILKYVDFGEYKIFDSALGQHNSIFLFEKNIIGKNKKTNVIKVDDYSRAKDYSLSEILRQDLKLDGILKFNSQGQNEIYDEKTYNIHFNNSCVFEIIKKIEINGEILLGKLCTVSGGVSSSADKVRNANLKHCSLDEQQMSKIEIGDGILVLDYDEVTKLDFSNKEMMYIKPYFKSSEIEKYITNNIPSKYLVYATHNNADEIIQQEKIYKHLCRYKSILESRSQDIELERAMEKGYWFVLTNGRNRIDFKQPKIVCPYRTKDNVFGYNEVEWYAGRDVYYLVDVKINIKFLLGLLNSKFIKFWLEYKGKRKGDIYEIYPEPLKNIPIVYSDKETIEKIAYATDKIMEIVNEEQKYYGNTREKEIITIQEQINCYVYNLYNLSQEEIKFINEL